MSKSYKTQKLPTGIHVAEINKVRISKPTVTRDVIAFDFGLWFKKGSPIEIYIDPDLQATIDHLLDQHGQLIIKTNFFSDDVLAITPSQNTSVSP